MGPLDLPPDLLQWIFSPSDLYRTPSAYYDRYTLQHERIERARGIEFMFRTGLYLQMPQHVMAAAAVYFHRFYMRYSLVDYHRFEIAATCLFLAGKVEEFGRKLSDVAIASVAKLFKGCKDPLKEHPKEVQRIEQIINVYELLVLDALCFDLEIDHAQGHLVQALEEIYVNDEVADLAWTVANDALYTPLCLLQPPNVVACACYLLGMLLHLGKDATLDQLLTEDGSGRWKEAFRISENEMPGVRDSLAIIIEFWAAMDEKTRAQFNTKIEDLPRNVANIAPPSNSRPLSSYAPNTPQHYQSATTPYANGTNGSGSLTPWNPAATPNANANGKTTPYTSQSGARTDASGGESVRGEAEAGEV